MFTFGLMVRIGTALGPGAVRDALTALRGRYPTLEAADDDLPFPLVVRRSATASTWVEVAEAGLAEPFGPTDAHLRLTMLRIGPVTDLVLICDHSLADGRTGGYVVRDLVTLLAAPGAALPPAAPTATLADLLPAGVEPLPVAGPMPEPPPRRFEVVHGRLPRPRTTALLERCRQEGTTLHPALCVAWVRALAQTGGLVTGALPPAVSIPVDARRLLPPDRQEAVGLLITTLVIPVDLGTGFWVAARAVSQDLAHRLTPDQLRERVRHNTEEFRTNLTASQADPAGASVPRPIGYELSMTNLGRLDLPSDGPVPVQACYGMVNVLEGERTVAVCAVAGRLHLALTTFRGEHDEGWPGRALASAVGQLETAMGAGSGLP